MTATQDENSIGPWCQECGERCCVVEADFGIGAYEHFGNRGVDVQKAVMSDCCGAPAYARRENGVLRELVEEL